MNFLPLRDNIYNWTLQTDQQLFNQVSKMVQYIFEAQRNIGQSISATKTCLTQSSVLINNNFNHFLKLSQSKFTQNKIEQKRLVSEQIGSKIEQESVQKSKMDILKQALNISIKNLQIKQNQNQNDNASVSEYSLSQAVFKNARLPPYFGSKQFRAKKYLDLFYDEDLIQNQSRIHSQSFSNLPLSSPSQPNNNLAPPPSLDSLNLGNSNSLSAPPLLNNLPPPPPLLNTLPPIVNGLLPPPPLINNLPLPPVINIAYPSLLIQNVSSSFASMKSQDNLLEPFISQGGLTNNQISQESTAIKASEPIKAARNLTMQQQLALKLKHGKNYKAFLPQVIPERQNDQILQKAQNKSSQSFGNQIIQSTKANRQSYRESTNIDSFLSQNIKPFSKPTFEQQSVQQQQQNSLFAASKNKNKVVVSVPQKKKQQKIQADLLMSRSTFNQDLLFKKKPTVSPVIKKAEQKKNALFNNSDQQQDIFAKTKKKTEIKKVQKKPQPKVNKLFDNDEEEEGLDILKISNKKKTETKVITQKQVQKKQQVVLKKQPIKLLKKQQKKNSLFQEEDEEEDILKSFKKSSKKQKPVAEVKKNQPKNSLFSAIQQVEEPISEVKAVKIEEKQVIIDKTVQQKKLPHIIQTQTQQDKKRKRIAAMGFGLGPMMPKGLIITKPSQAKQQESKAIKQEQELKKKKQKQQAQELQIRKKAQQKQQRQLQTKQNSPHQKKIVQIQYEQVQNTSNLQQVIVQKKQIQKLQFVQVKQIKQTISPPQKQVVEQQTKIQVKIIEQEEQSSQTQLTLGRRKKGKPTKKIAFDYDEQEQPKTIIVNQIKQKAQPQKKVEVEQVKVIKKPDIKQRVQELQPHDESQQESKRKRMQKIAKMGGMGMMGMGMGMGMMNPLMSQGIKITKPSQAKIQQKLALQRLVEEQEEKIRLEAQKKQRLEQELQKQRQQQQNLAQQRRIQQQKAQKQYLRQQALQQQEQRNARQKQILREQQERQMRAYQQQQRQQQERRRIEQQNRRILQAKQQQMKIQRQRKIQQEKAQQYQRIKLEQQNKKKQKKAGLPIFNLPADKNNQKAKIQQKKDQLFVPKLPQKTNPMGVPSLNPLGNTSSKLVPPISSNKLGSNNLPSIQSLSNQNKPKPYTRKNGLFDQNQDEGDDFSIKKKTVVQKKAKNVKGGLFDQEDDEDFGFKPKKKQQNQPKPATNLPQKNKASLFGNQEDDAIIVPKKKQVKVQVQQKIQVVPTSIAQKANNKNKIIFNQSDEDEPFSIKTKLKTGLQNQATISPLKKTQVVNKIVQQETQAFGKKPLAKSPIQAPFVKKIQAPKLNKPSINPLGNSQKKKTLFDNSDDDQPMPKAQQKKQVQIKRQPIIQSKNQAPKASLFDNSDEEDQPKSRTQNNQIETKKVQISAPTQNKKNLFNSDQSQDEQDMRKKREANRKLKKLI